MHDFLQQLQNRLNRLSYFFASRDPDAQAQIQFWIDNEMYLEADEALEVIELAIDAGPLAVMARLVQQPVVH